MIYSLIETNFIRREFLEKERKKNVCAALLNDVERYFLNDLFSLLFALSLSRSHDLLIFNVADIRVTNVSFVSFKVVSSASLEPLKQITNAK